MKIKQDIIKGLTLLKELNIVPNFTQIARDYNLDYRTVKKHYLTDKEKTVINIVIKKSKLRSI